MVAKEVAAERRDRFRCGVARVARWGGAVVTVVGGLAIAVNTQASVQRRAVAAVVVVLAGLVFVAGPGRAQVMRRGSRLVLQGTRRRDIVALEDVTCVELRVGRAFFFCKDGTHFATDAVVTTAIWTRRSRAHNAAFLTSVGLEICEPYTTSLTPSTLRPSDGVGHVSTCTGPPPRLRVLAVSSVLTGLVIVVFAVLTKTTARHVDIAVGAVLGIVGAALFSAARLWPRLTPPRSVK